MEVPGEIAQGYDCRAFTERIVAGRPPVSFSSAFTALNSSMSCFAITFNCAALTDVPGSFGSRTLTPHDDNAMNFDSLHARIAALNVLLSRMIVLASIGTARLPPKIFAHLGPGL